MKNVKVMTDFESQSAYAYESRDYRKVWIYI